METSIQIETKNKIGLEELEVLQELESIGIFLDPNERRAFRKEVCGPNVNRYKDINEDDFEAAFYRAKEHLQKRGQKIFEQMLKR